MNLFKLLAIVIVISVAAESYAGSVKYLSKEFHISTPTGSFSEVKVTCSGIAEEVIIQRADGSSSWCPKGVPSMCTRGKIKAAIKACSSKYKKALAKNAEEPSESSSKIQAPAPKINKKKKVTPKKKPVKANAKKSNTKSKSPAVSKDALSIESDQLSIEEKRILIEKQKLELRQRELELKREEIKLKQQKKLIDQSSNSEN